MSTTKVERFAACLFSIFSRHAHLVSARFIRKRTSSHSAVLRSFEWSQFRNDVARSLHESSTAECRSLHADASRTSGKQLHPRRTKSLLSPLSSYLLLGSHSSRRVRNVAARRKGRRSDAESLRSRLRRVARSSSRLLDRLSRLLHFRVEVRPRIGHNIRLL